MLCVTNSLLRAFKKQPPAPTKTPHSRILNQDFDPSKTSIHINDFDFFSNKLQDQLKAQIEAYSQKEREIEEQTLKAHAWMLSNSDLSPSLQKTLHHLDRQQQAITLKKNSLHSILYQLSNEILQISNENRVSGLLEILKLIDKALLEAADPNHKDILEHLKVPFRFQVYENVFKELSQRLLMELKSIHPRMGAGREIKVASSTSVNTYPLVLSADAAIAKYNIISPNNAFISINTRDLNLAIGGGDSVTAHGGTKSRFGQETLKGHESLERYSRELALEKIDMCMQEKAPGVLKSTTEDLIRDTYTAIPQLEKLFLNQESYCQIPRRQWNFPFKLLTTHKGFSLYGKAINGVLASEGFRDTQKGMGYYYGKHLFDYLMDKNNGLICQEAQPHLRGSSWRRFGPSMASAVDVDRALDHLIRDYHVAQGSEKKSDTRNALGAFQATARQALESQVRDLIEYYQLASNADQLKAHDSSYRQALKLVAAKEKAFGVKGRGEYIKKATFAFTKSIQIYKRSCVETRITEQSNDPFLNDLLAKSAPIFKDPGIYLGPRDQKCLHVIEATPISWHRQQTAASIDLKGFGVPGGIEAKVTRQHIPCWGVPELEGHYIEFSLDLRASIPAGNIAQLSTYLASKVGNSFKKKLAPHTLNYIKSELQDTLLLLDTNRLPLNYGMRIEMLVEDTSRTPCSKEIKKQRFQKYYTRILSLTGHKIGGSIPVPGIVTSSLFTESNDVAVHKEFIGTSTMNYLWRHYSGFLNAQDPFAWKAFCDLNNEALKKLFKNLSISDHPIQQSYRVFLDKIRNYCKYLNKEAQNPFEERILHFENIVRQFAENELDTGVDTVIESFENLFTLFYEEVWKNQLMATKNKLGTGDTHFASRIELE